MLQPNVTVALASNTEQPTLVLLTNDTTNLLTHYHWPLADLEKQGYAGICHLVGNAALRMLAAAHPDIFAAHPLLVPPPPIIAEPVVMITELISLSLQTKSRACLGALDLLFTHHAAELAQTGLPEAWPEIRDRILRFQAD
jgi:hypothetical protein